MIDQIKNYSILVLLFLMNYGCSEDDNPVNPPVEKVLLNTSFEENGQPSAEGWKIISGLSDNFSTDTPDSGGSYSLVLEAGWNGGLAKIQVPTLLQYSQYQLSFHSKFYQIEGRATLYLIRGGNVVSENSLTIDDTTWTSYSLSANYSLIQGDSLLVTLYGGYTQLLYGQTYFDLFKLEALD
jgi:hypothetical protein